MADNPRKQPAPVFRWNFGCFTEMAAYRIDAADAALWTIPPGALHWIMHYIEHALKKGKRPATPAAGKSGTKARHSPAAARNAASGGWKKSK